MLAPHELFLSAQQWKELRAAWRGRAENPLLQYFRLARRRRSARGQHRGSIAYLAFACVFIGGVSAAVTLEQARAGDSSTWLPELYGVAAALACGCITWLGKGMFDALVTSSCALSLPGRRKLDLQLDAPLSASRLSDAEMLVGLGWPALAGLLPRMACAALVSWGFCVLLAYFEGFRPTLSAPPSAMPLSADPVHSAALFIDLTLAGWQQALLMAPLSLGAILWCGTLGTLSLLLLALCAGRGQRMDVHAGVLAFLYTFNTLGFALFAQAMSGMLSWQYGRSGTSAGQLALAELEPLACIGWLLALLATVLLGLRPLQQRRALGLMYALPLLFVGCLGGMMWLASSLSRFPSGNDPTHYFIDLGMSWSMFAPVSVITMPHPVGLGTGLQSMLADGLAGHHWRWPFMALAQLALASGLLRAALGSISVAREAGAE